MVTIIILGVVIAQYIIFAILSWLLLAYLDLPKNYRGYLLYNTMIPFINVISFLMIVYVFISVKFSRKFDEFIDKYF
jgi:hypothetical protein